MKRFFFMTLALAAFIACDKGSGNAEPEPEPTPDPVLNVSPLSLDFAAEGEVKSFTISANNDWTATENVEWISLDKTSGVAADNVLVTVTAVENDTEEAMTAEITVTAGGLTKTVTLVQAAAEVVVTPPVTSGSTYELISSSPLVYADDLKDGGLYVLYSAEYTKCWMESNGELSVSDNQSGTYSSAEVFEFKLDETDLNTTFDYYGNLTAGYWKSLSTGKYLDEDFGLNSDLASAMHIEYANNWGSYNADNELNVLDAYPYPVYAGSNSLWYIEADGSGSFYLGPNSWQQDYSYNNTMRKWIVYEVAAVEE